MKHLLLLPLSLVLLLAACSTTTQSPSLSTQSEGSCVVINTNDSGDGSLRAAIADSSCSTITFHSSLSGQTITLTSGQLTINKDLTITGPSGSITISRDTSRDSDAAVADNVKFFRVFLIGASSGPDVTVTLENLTITDGRVDVGAGIYVYPNGFLTVKNSTVSHNTATNTGPGGGGIQNNGGTVHISRSFIRDNNANGWGGGIFTEAKGTTTLSNSTISHNDAILLGGGIASWQESNVTISDSTISHNTAQNYGGIIHQGGTLEVVRSTISENKAQDFAGGIGSLVASTFTLSQSTVSGNTAIVGGGIVLQDSTNTILNSTIADNTASGAGGGIALLNGRLTLSHSTVAGNTAQLGGGGIRTQVPSLTLHNSIVAGNLDTSSHHDLSCAIHCENVGVTATYSLIGSKVGYSLANDTNTNIEGVDPKFELDNGKPKLADNGGPTKTVALLADSPAVDKGTCTDHTDTTIATDQRGVKRPQGSTCDIGAFELEVATGFAFSGFFAPVDNTPVVNVVKAGQAIPVKFSLGGDFGLAIFENGYPRSQQVTCNTSDPQDTVSETVNAGGSSLSYDTTINRYTYVWKTEKNWTNTCRTLTLVFSDGTTQTANFRFTR